MCYICVANNLNFQLPGKTLVASQADVQKATEYLHTIGFSGLTFEDHPSDNWVRLKFKDFNKFLLDKTFGTHKKASQGRIQWIIPGKGAVYVNEKRKRVLIQNIEQVEKRHPPRPLPPIDTPPFNPDVDKKTFAPDQLIDLYKRIQATGNNRSACADFMQKIWHYWNAHKFTGQMDQPHLGFLKDAGLKMRKRGHWLASRRELMISPRLFNARFDVFAEVFLHEMCHQAVSEIDRVRETVNRGHGPRWASWMRKVGLEPNRYDKNDNLEYMTSDERAEHEAKKERVEDAKDGLRPRNPTAVELSNLRFNPVPLLYVDSNGKRLNGYLFYNPKRPKVMNFITDEQLRNGSSGTGWTWLVGKGVPGRTFERTVEPDPEYKSKIQGLVDRLASQREGERALREARNRRHYVMSY